MWTSRQEMEWLTEHRADDRYRARGAGPVSRSTISRARREPGHPVNGPDADMHIEGQYAKRRAPADQVIAWWARRKGPGPAPGTRRATTDA